MDKNQNMLSGSGRKSSSTALKINKKDSHLSMDSTNQDNKINLRASLKMNNEHRDQKDKASKAKIKHIKPGVSPNKNKNENSNHKLDHNNASGNIHSMDIIQNSICSNDQVKDISKDTGIITNQTIQDEPTLKKKNSEESLLFKNDNEDEVANLKIKLNKINDTIDHLTKLVNYTKSSHEKHAEESMKFVNLGNELRNL